MKVLNRERIPPSQLALSYLDAKAFVISAGFLTEIEWQSSLSVDQVTESGFLREAAWVVLSAGFRESVLRKRFQCFSSAFLYWSSAKSIMAQESTCRREALRVFNHQRKIEAVLTICDRVAREGFDQILRQLRQNGLEFISDLPFMGPITSLHLAKNLGLPVVKPDRHLTRIAERAGCKSVQELCESIANTVGDALPVIDLVIWRYATLTSDYLRDFFMKADAEVQ